MAEEKDNKGKTDPKPEQRPPAPPVPSRISINSYGRDGLYRFDIQVMSNYDKGIKAWVRILEGTNPVDSKETNDNGFLYHKAGQFSEEEQEFRFTIEGTGITEERILDGPEKIVPPKKPKKLASGGFWANVQKAIKDNRRKK